MLRKCGHKTLSVFSDHRMLQYLGSKGIITAKSASVVDYHHNLKTSYIQHVITHLGADKWMRTCTAR